MMIVSDAIIWSVTYVACGLYYKNILMIVSADRKLCLYYKCFSSPSPSHN
jgi:hypothetical protein